MRNILEGRWVFDSNILIYGLDKYSRFHKQTFDLFTLVRDKKIQAIVAQQNIVETIHTFIRGYKLSVKSIIVPLEGLIAELGIEVIAPYPTTHQRFLNLLLNSRNPSDVFDYFLAATMIDNGAYRILTINTKDFVGIKEIEAVNPFNSKIRNFDKKKEEG